jgi:hypothetical protein
MMRTACIALVLSLALALAGCGGSKTEPSIPASNAQALLTQLDQVANNFDNGACNGAHAKVAELISKVDQLPSTVNKEVRTNLRNGMVHLDSLIGSQCKRPETTTTSASTTTTTPTTTTTETSSTTSSTPQTTITSTSSTTTSTPAGGGVVPPTGTSPSGGVTSP